MTEDAILREQLTSLLKGGHAHMTFDDAVKDFPIDQINTTFTNGTYSSSQLLEHIRITQQDILDFIINPMYQEKKWPKDYWPQKGKKATKKEWLETITRYHADVKELEKIINKPKTNLFEKIPHGDGQTILREIHLIVDHTAYHLGEFAIMRQVMNTWPKK